ncbi:hypothetical protein [Mucilaginibacter flavus]|uniref:hypothetical protein n=1 Tax=Mucilaginibacter flavus TaxID=931504 RepID=UPI0025B4996C|nr:hypothetical protein [Mucilaginibacter flavus]MDN3579837.1 hypothetical protein [Mucilaginibacter flavus]
MKKIYLAALLLLLFSCSFMIDDFKQLDLNEFKITVPKSWEYIKQRGVDSFIGLISIKSSKSTLQFDLSNSGYANSLILTEQEYLEQEEWKQGSYFYKDGVTYTADFNVKNERTTQMKKLGTTDSTLVHVEADPSYQTKTLVHLPSPSQKVKYATADYIADLTYNDSTIFVPIEIPTVIKMHNIKIDTIEKYVIKTIWPKIPGKGMTGVYFKSRNSRFNFQMSAADLSKSDQDLALQAFKSIVIK